MFWSGYLKELKNLGRNDVTHNEEIPRSSIIKINEILAVLLKLMQCDKGDQVKYRNLVQELPLEYQDDYHRLLQCGTFYVIGMHFAKRGKEGKSSNDIAIFVSSLKNQKTIGFISIKPKSTIFEACFQ
jgi:hypothetical protein